MLKTFLTPPRTLSASKSTLDIITYYRTQSKFKMQLQNLLKIKHPPLFEKKSVPLIKIHATQDLNLQCSWKIVNHASVALSCSKYEIVCINVSWFEANFLSTSSLEKSQHPFIHSL